MARVLSGVQPSGLLHLGNYFGAIKQHLEMSHGDDNCFFFIADYHALTTIRNAQELEGCSRSRSYVCRARDQYRKSGFRAKRYSRGHRTHLASFHLQGMGLLERAHSYKDKVARGIKSSVGLFTYPALMASDILIYDADVVPVGKDQVQHVEMTQDMAGHFNHRYQGEFPAVPSGACLRHLKCREQMVKRCLKAMATPYGFSKRQALKKAVNKIVTDSRLPEEPKDPDT